MEISAKTLRFIEEHREDDTRTLALQSKKYPDVDMAAAVTQIAGRQVAARKIPSWYPVSALWYPPHLSMEQCSSEAFPANRIPRPGYVSECVPTPTKGNYAKPAHKVLPAFPHNQPA